VLPVSSRQTTSEEAISPSFIEAGLGLKEIAPHGDGNRTQVPSGKIGTVQDVANVVLFLGSGLSDTSQVRPSMSIEAHTCTDSLFVFSPLFHTLYAKSLLIQDFVSKPGVAIS
jgi:hypothetical protein